MPHSRTAAHLFAAAAGVVLRGFFALISLVRRPRPIHAHGLLLIGEMERFRPSTPSGVSWIDAPGEPAAVRGRLSRSVGLPTAFPDVIGLALRMDTGIDTGIDIGTGTGNATADLELASTGSGVPGRFSLAPHRSPARAFFGTLLPYRGGLGPVLIGARPIAPSPLPADLPGLADALRGEGWTLSLEFAAPAGPWHPFARLSLRTDPDQDDTGLRFDAVRRSLPGAGWYRWIRLLRQPSYRAVQD